MQKNVGDNISKPTGAFVGASWGALFVGLAAYLLGLWNSNMALNEKGYYLAIMAPLRFSAKKRC